MKIVKDIRPDITSDKICRLLGYRKNRRLSKRLINTIDESIEKSRQFIKPRILYTEKRIEKADNRSVVLEEDISLQSNKLPRVLKKCNRTTVFLATIGKGIESFTQKLIEQKKVADAYIYDTIGSVAAEDIVEKFQKKFDVASRKREEKTTVRFSPGYCDWPVQEQEKIFQMIDNSLIDVQLCSGCLMIPRKSVSGIFGIGKLYEIGEAPFNPCSLCRLQNCSARRSQG